MTAGQTREPGEARRGLVLALLVLVICGVVPYMLGAPLWRAAVIAATGGLVTYLLVRAMDVRDSGWPLPSARTDVLAGRTRTWLWEGLGTAGTQRAVWELRVRPRLAGLATAVLARRGVPPGSDAARELLGERGYELLADPDAPAPNPRDLDLLCNSLSALATDAASPNRPVPVPRALAPLFDQAAGTAKSSRARPGRARS